MRPGFINICVGCCCTCLAAVQLVLRTDTWGAALDIGLAAANFGYAYWWRKHV